MRSLRGVGLLIAVMASPACDGNVAPIGGSDGAQLNDGGSVTFATGVNGAIPLNKLTSAQATQLCSAADAFAASFLCPYVGLYDGLVNAEISGIGTSLDDAQLQNACRDGNTAADCAASACSPSGLTANPASCQSTVADLVACFTDSAIALMQQLGSLPACATLTSAELTTFNAATVDAGFSFYRTPASCTALQANCGGYVQISSYSF